MNFISQNLQHDDETLISCYDDVPLWSAPFGKLILELIEYRQGITALDIGFGTGFPFLELAMRLGSSSFVYGIDPWVGAIKRTQLKAKQYSISNIKIIESSAAEIPIVDKTIDLIVSNNGLNNIAKLSDVMRECARIAKPNCQFLMTMNLDTTMAEFYNVLRTSFLENGLSKHIGNIDRHIREKRPPISEIAQVFNENGFHKTQEVHDSFTFKFSDGTALLNHYFLRMAFIDSWIKCIPESFQELIMTDVEQRINEIAARQIGFSLSVPIVCLEFRKKETK
jgi:ubiquinone/menaquinone biosynthesis C-methylase UbiE